MMSISFLFYKLTSQSYNRLIHVYAHLMCNNTFFLGSHGDGHPSNTDTPLVAWGAGIGHPMLDSHNNHPDISVRFVDEHIHNTPTPSEWGLNGISRMDVNQADIAPLMVVLFGILWCKIFLFQYL